VNLRRDFVAEMNDWVAISEIVRNVALAIAVSSAPISHGFNCRRPNCKRDRRPRKPILRDELTSLSCSIVRLVNSGILNLRFDWRQFTFFVGSPRTSPTSPTLFSN